jgi:uncharacterized protein (DUF433 family)
VPEKRSGAPVIVHARVRPGDPAANRDQGPDWLAENDALPVETVRKILAFNEQKLFCVAAQISKVMRP